VDFTMSQTQQAVTEAAAGLFGGYQPGPGQAATGRAMTGQDAAGRDAGDRALWKELARAGLLGLAVPDWLGGEGLGVAETAVLLTETGRAAAPVPALATLVMGGSWLARCTSPSGTPNRRRAPTSPRCAPGRCGTGTVIW
jgi:alkylation response protein AidB-like acyl-CoA dehydrogenase